MFFYVHVPYERKSQVHRGKGMVAMATDFGCNPPYPLPSPLCLRLLVLSAGVGTWGLVYELNAAALRCWKSELSVGLMRARLPYSHTKSNNPS